MASIASLALKLTADATDLLGTIEKVQRRMTSFTASLATKFTQPFRFVTDPFRSIEAGFTSFFDLVGEGSQIKKIADVGRAADKLGTSTQTLLAIARAARSDVSEMVGPLFRATAAIGKMGNAADEVTTPLEAWGIDVKAIKGSADPVAALFDAIAEKMPGAANKAELAMAGFGRGGLAMVEALQKGKGGLAEIKEMMEAEGNLFSRADAQRAIDAAAAVGKLKKSFEGIKTQLALSFAPIVTEIGKGIQSWIEAMGGGRAIAQMFAKALLDIAETLVIAAQAITNAAIAVGNLGKHPDAPLQKVPDSVKAMPKVDFSGAIDKINEFRKGIDDLGKGGFNIVTEIMKQVTQQLKEHAQEQIKLGAQANDLATKLGHEAEMFGKTGAEAEIMKLKIAGATEAQLAGARAAAAQMELLERRKFFKDFGKTIEEEILTPFDKWSQKLDEIDRWIGEGGDLQTGLLAIAKANDTLMDSMEQKTAGPAALFEGTSAAISAVNAAFGSQDRTNPFKVAEDILARQERIQAQIADNTRRQIQEAGLPVPNQIAP